MFRALEEEPETLTSMGNNRKRALLEQIALWEERHGSNFLVWDERSDLDPDSETINSKPVIEP